MQVCPFADRVYPGLQRQVNEPGVLVQIWSQ